MTAGLDVTKWSGWRRIKPSAEAWYNGNSGIVFHSMREVSHCVVITSIGLALSGCAMSGSSPLKITGTQTRPDCTNWLALSYSAKGDTPETVAEIIAQNARHKAACGD